jgi:hypothetical protein
MTSVPEGIDIGREVMIARGMHAGRILACDTV